MTLTTHKIILFVVYGFFPAAMLSLTLTVPHSIAYDCKLDRIQQQLEITRDEWAKIRDPEWGMPFCTKFLLPVPQPLSSEAAMMGVAPVLHEYYSLNCFLALLTESQLFEFTKDDSDRIIRRVRFYTVEAAPNAPDTQLTLEGAQPQLERFVLSRTLASNHTVFNFLLRFINSQNGPAYCPLAMAPTQNHHGH